MRRIFSSLNRFVLPGLAFKAVVIGGGYATGRELVEFFLPSGPTGGLLGMILAMACWSAVCAMTFLFAKRIGAMDYQSFFRGLLGRYAFLFEIVYLVELILVLSVFGSAAGAIGAAVLNLPLLVGSLTLILLVLSVCAAGQGAAEAVFKYVSVLLYGVYALFLAFSFWKFGPAIGRSFAGAARDTSWVSGGITYASYNVVGAVLILPVLRHLRSGRDAVIAGLLAGPLAMVPAIIFFVCLAAFYPSVLSEALPSDYVLGKLGMPVFHIIFQLMIFFALLECSVGAVQALNVRIEAYNRGRGRKTPVVVRVGVPLLILFGSIFIASAVGLIELIARGYRAMAYCILAIYILPLFTVGVAKLSSHRQERLPHEALGSGTPD